MSARSLNKVLLIGNLTRDPELRYTPQGTAVCTFGLATNRSWTPNEGGEMREETEYHRIVAWSKLGEICSQLLYKGRKVFVEGRLQTRSWQSQDGQERTSTEVVIDNMIALGAPKGGDMREEPIDYAMPPADMGAAMDVQQQQPEATTDEAQVQEVVGEPIVEEQQVEEPLQQGGQAKKSKKEKKSEDVADDIPF